MQKKRIHILLIFLLGGGFFVFRFGLTPVIPSNISWLMSQVDGATHFLGWAFFKNDTWGWPPGIIESYFAPLGTTIGYTDSLPLLAFPLKIFRQCIPLEFQYLGFWFILNHALQGVFAFLLLRTKIKRLEIVYIGSLFFIFSPIFIWRFGHIALSSHWVILAGLLLYFEDSVLDKKTKSIQWIILSAVVALIHPYLAASVLGIYLIFLLKELTTPQKRYYSYHIIECTLIFGTVFILWYLTGYFKLNNYSQKDYLYGTYSLNTLSPFNPQWTSSFLNNLPIANDLQKQTYCYLGLGMIILLVLAIVCFLKKRHLYPNIFKNNLPIILGATAFLLFALSNKITFGNQTILTYPLPDPVRSIFNVYQASSRFFWPVYYLIFLATFVIIDKYGLHRKTLFLFLCCMLALQVYDIKNLILNTKFNKRQYRSHLKSPDWNSLMEGVQKIQTAPLFSNVVYPSDYKDLAMLAAKYNCSITAGYVARTSFPMMEEIRRDFYDKLHKGFLTPNTIYIFNPDYFQKHNMQIIDKTSCSNIDGYVVCKSIRTN